MRPAITCLVLIALGAQSVPAVADDFPYRAVIEADDVYVRSGPGRAYYPTGKLGLDDPVMVHRHDPGGWFMISPPPGSFSWIIANAVEKETADQGVLIDNNIVVRVGSSLSGSRDVEQKRLSRGDRVKIIGEKTLQSERGVRKWYKIEPPRGEYRWIMGQYVRRLSHGSTPRNNPSDPFDFQNRFNQAHQLPTPQESEDVEPPRSRSRKLIADLDRPRDYDSVDKKPDRQSGKSDALLAERKLVRTHSPLNSDQQQASRQTGPSRSKLEDDRERFDQLDAGFHQMLRRETAQWDFTSLRRKFAQLRQSDIHVALKRRIDFRLADIDYYQTIKADYDQFARLTDETRQREATLLALRRSRSQPQQRQTARPPHQSRQIASPKRTRFAGAGVIRRAATRPPGAPRHVLLALDGRILAYLQETPGIQLDRYLGRAMGIDGKRVHQSQRGIDRITVKKLTPVRLIP